MGSNLHSFSRSLEAGEEKARRRGPLEKPGSRLPRRTGTHAISTKNKEEFSSKKEGRGRKEK